MRTMLEMLEMRERANWNRRRRRQKLHILSVPIRERNFHSLGCEKNSYRLFSIFSPNLLEKVS